MQIDQRIQFADQLLNQLCSYDKYKTGLKAKFMNMDQMVVKDGEILFNELLIMDDNIYNKDTSFTDIYSNIAIILNVIFKSLNDEFKQIEIDKFILDLGTEKELYENMNDLYTAFKSIISPVEITDFSKPQDLNSDKKC